jgi:hypothetical protein
VVRAAREAGATNVWCNVLYLRPGTREHFLACLAEDWPELLPTYERLYAKSAYLKGPEGAAVREQVASLRRELGVADRRPIRLAPAPQPEQLALTLPSG